MLGDGRKWGDRASYASRITRRIAESFPDRQAIFLMGRAVCAEFLGGDNNLYGGGGDNLRGLACRFPRKTKKPAAATVFACWVGRAERYGGGAVGIEFDRRRLDRCGSWKNSRQAPKVELRRDRVFTSTDSAFCRRLCVS